MHRQLLLPIVIASSLIFAGAARADGYEPVARAAPVSLQVSNWTGFYANGDVLLFPTYHTEGFPMVIFNAAAAGLPIITTRIRAAVDYLAESENCLWVEPKSPHRLAEKIASLLAQPDEQNRMRLNNKLLAERFSAETVTREYLESYKRIEQ